VGETYPEHVAADITIRNAGAPDAGAIARVHVASWRVAYRGLLADEALAQLSTGGREGMWRKALADEDARQSGGRIKVAEAENCVLGFVAAGPGREDDVRARNGEIYAIYVHPDHWSSGVGQALLDSALADLIGAGFDDVMLWVLDSNAGACRFYELAGWARDGRSKTERFAALPDFDAEVNEVCFRRDLR
jgi:ribosomal protein S18 acetylase RimI-like enzyme